MAGNAPESDGIAKLDNEEVPFEAPPGRLNPARPGAEHHVRPRVARGKKQKSSRALVGLLAITYAVGAVGIGAIDQGFLLFAWLVTGPLIFIGYRALTRSK